MRLVDIDRVPVSDEAQDADTFFHNPCIVQLPRWAIEEIVKACAVDPQDREFCGKWFNTATDIPNLLMNVCSECGFQYPSAIRTRFNYCPHCGARMDL